MAFVHLEGRPRRPLFGNAGLKRCKNQGPADMSPPGARREGDGAWAHETGKEPLKNGATVAGPAVLNYRNSLRRATASKLASTQAPFCQFKISDSTRPSQPLGGRTFKMKAIVRARSTTSESPYLPGLIQLGPYMASGTLVSYDHGDPCVEA